MPGRELGAGSQTGRQGDRETGWRMARDGLSSNWCGMISHASFLDAPTGRPTMTDSPQFKPTHKEIKRYYDDLAGYAAHEVAHEGAASSAFQNLLAATCKKAGWQLVPPTLHPGSRQASSARWHPPRPLQYAPRLLGSERLGRQAGCQAEAYRTNWHRQFGMDVRQGSETIRSLRIASVCRYPSSLSHVLFGGHEKDYDFFAFWGGSSGTSFHARRSCAS